MLHHLPPAGDQGLVACGLASFRGRAAHGVSANSTPRACQRCERIRFRGSAVPRWDRVAVPAAVLPHTEVTRQHLLTAGGPEGARRLSGLIGFDPAMRAEYEYELVGVGCPSPKLAGS